MGGLGALVGWVGDSVCNGHLSGFFWFFDKSHRSDAYGRPRLPLCCPFHVDVGPSRKEKVKKAPFALRSFGDVGRGNLAV